jgi:hypothetical protein
VLAVPPDPSAGAASLGVPLDEEVPATRPPRIAPEAPGGRCDGWIADDAVRFAYAPERFFVVGDA